MEQSIGDILSGNEPEPEAVTEQVEQPEVQTEQPETVERPRGPDGKFIAKEETGVEPQEAIEAPAEPVPPTEPTNQLPKEEYSALRAIRDENKELKQKLYQIENHLMQRQQQPQPQAAPPVDFWDDPNAFLEQRDARIAETLFQRMEQRQTAQRMDQSEHAAKAKYADYDEAFSAFEQAVQLNPRLAHELANASDPGEFAYSKGKTALAIQNAGSIDALLASERAKWEAEIRAAVPQPRLSLPSTTAADGSVGGRSGPAWSGPAPLGDLLR
jgi:hypothetical protein